MEWQKGTVGYVDSFAVTHPFSYSLPPFLSFLQHFFGPSKAEKKKSLVCRFTPDWQGGKNLAQTSEIKSFMA